MGETVRVAAVQAEPVWLDMEATTDKTIRLIAEAATGGADLIAFPETWIPGYPVFLWSYPVYEQMQFVARYHANSPAIDGPQIARIREAAQQHSITVVVGFSEKDAGSLYMSQAVIGPGGDLVLHRRKLKPTHAERTLFGEGDGSDIKVIDTPLGRVGALQCFEHLQPLTKYAMYAQNEQIHVAGWPCLGILGNVPALSPESIMACTQTYALEGSAFVVAATQIMSDDGARKFPTADGGPTPVYTGGGGYARVYGPHSAMITQPLDPTEEGIVYADLDLSDIDLAKNTVDPAGHYARPDVTRLVFDDRPRKPVITPREQAAVELDSLDFNGPVELEPQDRLREPAPTQL
ncbi:carbon-nitrogen hydrolase family protein (plasmid) [Citricoccus sp. SGAir0253]|uniref:carbon-nitrogen hydrolase family protein n=1 Tax=Citricoccus sp. SGAir0253 TaxID=2567881 RepID=UPI0010CCC9B1|nr:carbon-nitrogen hydrolase family protein [Citricoccus sp. SGAir0253]QCU79564.1 carbon-nitrogen hydrolase family protein [Citricoccus sp. SGAir0253]